MSDPVLVIHGVANRSKAKFARVVRDLGRRSRRDVKWLDVYWGDLGARHLHLDRVLPPIIELPNASALETTAVPDPTRSESSLLLVLAAAQLEISGQAESHGGGLSAEAAEAVGVAWRRTSYLQLIDDPRALADVGRMVAAVMLPASTAEGSWALDLVGSIKRLFDPLDDLVAALGGRALGTIHQALRRMVVPELAKFLGDVLVYQRNRTIVQQRIWARLDGQRTLSGVGRTPDNPVTVVAHSLGGVLAFDAAVSGSRRLYIDAFVTFGSQAPFFHLIDPRDGPSSQTLPIYEGRRKLPIDSIRHWINLYEPMDPLAFVAGNVFRLSSGGSIEDRIAEHRPQAGLFTHSDYWEHPALARAVDDALGRTA